MADMMTLELEKRDVVGKQVRRLRREGLVPGVIHDHGKESIAVSGVFLDVQTIWQRAGMHHAVALKAGGKNYTALIREATFDPRTNFITHVVFNAVSANQMVDAQVPIRPKYDEDNDASPAERSGLMVLQQMDTIEVAAFPRDLPDVVEYDAEKLVAVGDQITVADLIVPKGVEFKVEPEHAVATVFEPSAVAAANDAAGGDAEDGDEAKVESDAGTTGEAAASDADKKE
jgi:large subunit ribosomal protein L25